MSTGQHASEFSLVLREQTPALKRLLATWVPADDVDDVLQQTAIKASRAWSGFRGDAEPATWLHQIARNAARDHLKSRSHRDAKRTESIAAEKVDPCVTDQPVRTKNLEKGEMNQCVHEYVGRLSAPLREVVELKDLRGLTHVEIAQQLGISVEAAKIRLHRARAALRRELEAGCEFYQNDGGNLACDRREAGDVSLAKEISSKVVTPETGARCSTGEGRNTNIEDTMSTSSSNCCAPTSCAAPAPAAQTGSIFTPMAAEFVALGAAIGANCELCLRHHTAEALKVGIPLDDIARAIEMAEKVKRTPAQLMQRLAERLLKNGGQETEAAPKSSGGCGCS